MGHRPHTPGHIAPPSNWFPVLSLAPILAADQMVKARLLTGRRREGSPRTVRAVRRSEGGQAMYGGLVAVPISAPVLALLHLRFLAFWDAATFRMLTRAWSSPGWGCPLNGCRSGQATASRFGLVLADAR